MQKWIVRSTKNNHIQPKKASWFCQSSRRIFMSRLSWRKAGCHTRARRCRWGRIRRRRLLLRRFSKCSIQKVKITALQHIKFHRFESSLSMKAKEGWKIRSSASRSSHHIIHHNITVYHINQLRTWPTATCTSALSTPWTWDHITRALSALCNSRARLLCKQTSIKSMSAETTPACFFCSTTSVRMKIERGWRR